MKLGMVNKLTTAKIFVLDTLHPNVARLAIIKPEKKINIEN